MPDYKGSVGNVGYSTAFTKVNFLLLFLCFAVYLVDSPPLGSTWATYIPSTMIWYASPTTFLNTSSLYHC